MLEILDGPRPGPLEGDAQDALGVLQPVGMLRGEKAEEGVEGRQPDVARAHGAVAGRFEVREKGNDHVGGEIVDIEDGDVPARVGGDEPEQQRETIAVAADRVRAQAAQGGQVVGEEGAERRGQGIRRPGGHGRLPVAWARGSTRAPQWRAKRALAATRRGSTNGR